jgi:hypothetical protein
VVTFEMNLATGLLLLALLFVQVAATGCSDPETERRPSSMDPAHDRESTDALDRTVERRRYARIAKLAALPEVRLSPGPEVRTLGEIIAEINAQTKTWPLKVKVATLGWGLDLDEKRIALDTRQCAFWKLMGRLAVAAEVGLWRGSPDGHKTLHVVLDSRWRLLPGYDASGPMLVGLMYRTGRDPSSNTGLYTPTWTSRYVLFIGAHWLQDEGFAPPEGAWTIESDTAEHTLRKLDRWTGSKLIALPDPPEDSQDGNLRFHVRIPLQLRWDIKQTIIPASDGMYPTTHPAVVANVENLSGKTDGAAVTVRLTWDPELESAAAKQSYTDALKAAHPWEDNWETLLRVSAKARQFVVVQRPAEAGNSQGARSTSYVTTGDACTVTGYWDADTNLKNIELWIAECAFVEHEVSLRLNPRTQESGENRQ